MSMDEDKISENEHDLHFHLFLRKFVTILANRL